MVGRTRKAPVKEQSIGEMIDELYAWKEEKKEIEAAAKAVEDKIKEREALLMTRLEEMGMDKASGKKANVAMRVNVVPIVKDWEAFYSYLHKNKAYHLLERRPSSTGCREIFERPAGKNQIPGVEPYDKVALSVTAMKRA